MQYNIIQIVADDLGFGDIGHFNGGLTRTPNIDRLFAEGAVFDTAYSASPVCAPARAALLTGRYPHRTGAIDTLEGQGLDRLALDERTIADACGAAGYRTGLIGKWHNGALDPRYSPTRRGFEEFFGFRGGWMDYWRWTLTRGEAAVAGDGRYLTDVWGEAAEAFVLSPDARPYYLMLAFNAPHYPLQAPPADLAAVKARLGATVSEDVATIYAMVEAMDRAVGRVLEALARSGRAERTLLLFTSDNGPHLAGDSARPNLDFRGFKGKVYEGGIRVPFVVHAPGIVPRRSVPTLLHFIDVMPTLLDACAIPPPADGLPIDGVSLWGSLTGEPAAAAARFWQWNRYTPIGNCNSAMREGAWKLVHPEIAAAMRVLAEDLEMDVALKYEPGLHQAIRSRDYRAPVGDADPPELYDLAADPAETCNLAARHPELAHRLAARLRQWFDEVERDRARSTTNTN